MDSLIDAAFIREFQPLPPRDRRLLIRQMGVPDVDHRDEGQFYEWLAARYRAGEAHLVDAALHACCNKADERNSRRRLIEFLAERTGMRSPGLNDPLKFYSEMLATAYSLKDDTPHILTALAPNFPDFLVSEGGSEDELAAEEQRDAGEEPSLAPIGTDEDCAVVRSEASVGHQMTGQPKNEERHPEPAKQGALAAADQREGEKTPFGEVELRDLISRLSRLLDEVQAGCDQAIILKMEDLASSLESETARRSQASLAKELTEEIATKFIDVRKRWPEVPDLSHPEALHPNQLQRILTELVRVKDAIENDRNARADLSRVIDRPRVEREVAQRALDAAEEFRENAQRDFCTLLQEILPGTPAPESSGSKPGHLDTPAVQIGDEAKKSSVARLETGADLSPDTAFCELQGDDVSSAEVEIETDRPGSTSPEPDRAIAPFPTEVGLHRELQEPGINQSEEDSEERSSSASNDGSSDEREAADCEIGNNESGWDQWIGRSLRSRRIGLAVHLAEARHLAGADSNSSIEPVVLEGLLYGGAVRASYDEHWFSYDRLGNQLRALQAACLPKPARDLLLYAGALRPALLQSQLAWQVLHGLEGEVSAQFNRLTEVVGSLQTSGISSIAELAAPQGEDELSARYRAVLNELHQWKKTAPNKKLSYQRATAVWQELASPNGAIGEVVEAIIQNDADAGNKSDSLLSLLANEKETLIQSLDSQMSVRSRIDPIEGNALKQLINHMSQVGGFISDWAAIREAEGIGRSDRHKARRQELLRELTASDTRALRMAEASSDTKIAFEIHRSVSKELITELQGGSPAIWSPAEALDNDLALLPAFPLNARRSFRIGIDDVVPLAAAADSALAEDVPAPTAAFAEAIVLGAASSAARLLPQLPADQLASSEKSLDRMETREREKLSERVSLLRQRLDDLQIAISDADPLPEALERDMTTLEQMGLEGLPRDSADAGDIADFPAAHKRLDVIQSRLDRARSPVAVRLEARIVAQEGALHQTLDECRTLLRDGDLGTLSEEIGQIERHGLAGLPIGSSLGSLERFAEILQTLGETPDIQVADLPRVASSGSNSGPFNFKTMAEEDRKLGSALLYAWIAVRRLLGTPARPEGLARLRDATVKLMTELRFTGVRADLPTREKAWFRINVTTDPLRSRENCLIPAFGSEADGQYAVLMVPGSEVGSCLTLFDNLPERVIVFVTDPLSQRQRRELQRKARAGTRSVAVVDTVTITALAATPDRGTRQMFDLAIPFGAAQPYADAGSQTSVEMFFGRDAELRRLVERQGACFVYGGRQLGKTALLKQIELRENNSSDRVALYCDIRAVGASMPASQVWQLIEDGLKARKVVLPEGPTLALRMRAWVSAKPGRYLLILLDEADSFLESEMSLDFPVIGPMKALMEETQRGVKFVFAGLHNVQRFHRAPNSPLLHLGSSINVGPLLGSDREAARQMVFEPMAAMGMKFERPTDAYHMLSLVGFYPSLMQSFGKTVVEAIAEKLRKPGDVRLPMSIPRSLIDACFTQQAFRTSVVERFQKTLQLDERYELITYAVWQRTKQDSSAGRASARGYPASVIRQLAVEWWPAGFRDTDSPDSFAAILDEMAEMGVLAREGESYALRSQRIAAMLGTDKEIEDRLLSFLDRAPKRKPDPMTSHRRMGKEWSPMSLRHESVLSERLAAIRGARIALIGAVPATGLSRLGETVSTLAQHLNWPKPRKQNFRTVEELVKVGQDEQRRARGSTPQVILVQDRWPTRDEIDSLRKHRVFRDVQRPLRMIFCGPHNQFVDSCSELSDVVVLFVGPLPEEAMFHWMNRRQLPYADSEVVQQKLRSFTGGYLDALDAIVLKQAEREDPAHLLRYAEQAGGELSLADLGLSEDLANVAKSLKCEIGDEILGETDLSEWLTTIGVPGDALASLRTLKVLEVVDRRDGIHRFGFNPLVSRLLA